MCVSLWHKIQIFCIRTGCCQGHSQEFTTVGGGGQKRGRRQMLISSYDGGYVPMSPLGYSSGHCYVNAHRCKRTSLLIKQKVLI